VTPPKDVFAANLAHERRRQCRSMVALARLAGIHASEISRLEQGQRDPRLWTIVRLARALDVPLAVLLRGIGKTEESAQDV
jgi:transcriptional regulator with XRE-family HTH domain